MAERAQRARWMKTDPDPDFEIPMMIDFINDPPNPDDAIRRAYMGAGFYSGYVIDCDGTMVKSHSWGWYDSGGEWWGLPLASIKGLTDFLDAYLKNPPACYGNPDHLLAGEGDAGAGPGPDSSPAAPSADPGPAQNPASPSGGCSVAPGASPVGLLPLLLSALLALRRRSFVDVPSAAGSPVLAVYAAKSGGDRSSWRVMHREATGRRPCARS
jgi:hypothetical protein